MVDKAFCWLGFDPEMAQGWKEVLYVFTLLVLFILIPFDYKKLKDCFLY